MPVVVAAVKALATPEFGLHHVASALAGPTIVVLLNGPVAQRLGINATNNLFGPGVRANATIGRALRLIMMNLGGGLPGVTALSGFGGPWRYTYCIAENEAESPWASYAAAHGFGHDDNVVTAIPLEGPVLVWDDASETPERLVVAIADMMSAIGGGNIYRQADMAVVLSPQHAEVFAKAGLSRDQAHALLIERAGRKLGEIRRGGIWRGAAGAQRWAFSVDLDDDEAFVPAIGDPGDLHLIVAGGSGAPATLVMHGITVASRAVTRVYRV